MTSRSATMAAPRNMTPEQRVERARRAARARWDKHNPEAQRRTDAIASLIATAPALAPEQIERLRALLGEEAAA